MRARRKWILLLIGLIIVGTVVWNLTREREPVYKGKTLSWWVNCRWYSSSGIGVTEQHDAIRQIGTNAIPFLLKWIAVERPPTWQLEISSFLEKMPRPLSSDFVVNKLSGYQTAILSQNCVEAFSALGTTATSAIPGLVHVAVNSKDLYKGRLAFDTLSKIGRESTPALLRAYSSAPEKDRFNIYSAINDIWPSPTDTAPHGFITSFFMNSDALVRIGATNFAKDHAPWILREAAAP